jgi:hypothetical protein
MDQENEMRDGRKTEVRELAEALQRSAGECAGAVINLWQAAEVMVAQSASLPARFEQTLAEQLRRRAHSLWEAAGRPEGQALDFWLAAEREYFLLIADSFERFWSSFDRKEPVSRAPDLRRAA